MVELALAKDEMAEDEEAAGLALDRDAAIASPDRRPRRSPTVMRAAVERIDPAAVAEADLEGRGYGEQTPALAELDQDAQAACPRDVVRIARDGEELVERGVADRQLRGEDAMHPGRGAES